MGATLEAMGAQAPDMLALRRLAAAIGSDPRLIQGAGGNVSIKFGDIMWVKASGTWLADAVTNDIMVPVALAPVRDAIARADALAERAETAVVADLKATGLRPSIETSMHAALPHPVVLHVHSVDAIALAVREDAAELLAERLVGLRWALVPYCRPGLPLTRAIGEATPGGAVDVLILANHGLVVAAADPASAEALLDEVVARLSCPPRSATAGDAAAVAAAIAGHGFRLPADPAAHAIATDEHSLAIAEAGVLYPDHVVFLGRAPLVLDPGEDPGDALARLEELGRPRPQWLIIRRLGIAVAEGVPRGAEEMVRCLADVAARIPAGAAVAVLEDDDIAALIDWDAEAYRRQLAAASG